MTPIGTGVLDFLLGFVVFLFIMIIYRVTFTWTMLWLPLLLLIQVILILGITLFASAVNVFYRDVRFIIPLLIQLWFYATPIIYPLSSVPGWLKPYYILNPMAGIIDGYRQTILMGTPPPFWELFVSAAVSVLILLGSYAYFKSVEWKFADLI